MEELLNNISQEGLLVICIVMSVVALLLAIFITAEMFLTRKKKKEQEEYDSHILGDTQLNIKYDENVKYEELDSESERVKAKEELQKIKEKLIREEIEKSLNEEDTSLNNVEITSDTFENKDSLESTKEFKVFNEQNITENNVVVENTNENTEVQEYVDEEVEPVEVNVIDEENTSVDIPVVVPTPEEVKEEPVALKVKEEPKKTANQQRLDRNDKEKIIDEYLNQAILKRIHEEKEKQLKLKEEIENERKVLLSDDNNVEVIDTSSPAQLPYIEDMKEMQKIEEDDTYKAKREYDVNSFIDEFVKEDTAPVEDTPTIDVPVIEENTYNIPNITIENKNNNVIIDELSKEEKKERPSLYEELEEENAIISIDELMKASKFGYTDEEMAKYLDEEDAIISIEELENLYKEVNEIAKNDNRLDFSNVDFKTVDDLPKISEEKKFKKSEIISPVFGEIKEDKDKEKEDISLTRLSEEIKKTNDFLSELRDLQKNLE